LASKQSFVYLSDDDLSTLGITTEEVLDATEAAIRGREEGSVWAAPKATILPPDGRYMMAALAAMSDPPLLANKTVLLNPRNPERGLPQINGLISLLNADTGLPVAVLDANWITGIRTAGASAVAARYMARKESSVIAFIGCGVQAHSHLELFSDMFPIARIKTFSRGRPRQEILCAAAAEKGISGDICDTAHDAVSDADIIVTSITVTYDPDFKPFLDANWMKPGAFAAVTDLGVPWIQDTLSVLDRVIIDDLEQEATMDKKVAPAEVVQGDLAGVVMGRATGRTDGPAGDNERTAFMFRGVPLGDLALSALCYRKAMEKDARNEADS